MKRDMKYEYIMIRCNEETKQRWREVLHEFKKRGLTAEDLLLLIIERVQKDYVEGKLI